MTENEDVSMFLYFKVIMFCFFL